MASVAAVFAMLTLLWKDWIEIVFRVDPDNHNGSLESVIVATMFVIAVSCSVLVRREWRMSNA